MGISRFARSASLKGSPWRSTCTPSPSPASMEASAAWATSAAASCSSSTSPPSAASHPSTKAWKRCKSSSTSKALTSSAFPPTTSPARNPAPTQTSSSSAPATSAPAFPCSPKSRSSANSKHPLYAELIAQQPTSTGAGKQGLIDGLLKFGATVNPEPEVLWNFEKFLISREGKVVARFSPDTLPTDAAITTAIEAELTK